MKRTLLLLLSLPLFVGARAQVSRVNPVPQRIEGERSIVAMPENYKIKQGLATDKAMKKYRKFVPEKAEGYYLKVTPKEAVVVGYDEAGLRYGKLTLDQITAGGKLETCTITDWPDVRFRGVVEGFYGTPWSQQARLSQLTFYGRNKLNVYIYGPKDDPYHSTPLWRQPYPAKEARQLQELVEFSKTQGVNFYWAIHPGQDIRWNVADRDSLVMKFESMYDLGVRSFAIFFDDIWGEGTRAEKQAELLNYLDTAFVQKKPDVSPLIVCPTAYNKAWANDEPNGYLRTLGRELNKSVEVMWTGNTVVHCIDKPDLEWINERIQRPAYIWWNFPVTDYCRDHLMLGKVYGNSLENAPLLSGFVSNPMEHAEASKISLYAIADYTWNMAQYDADRDWQRAIVDLLPTESRALRVFASFNEDAGPNGHGFRRDESADAQARLARATNLKDSADCLATICRELEEAANHLLTCKENPQLIHELRPWLLQAKNVADFGQAVTQLDLAANADDFKYAYTSARAIRQQMYELENSDVRHPLQPGIKVGERWLVPTLNKVFAEKVNVFNHTMGERLDPSADYAPYVLESDVPQLRLKTVSAQGNEVKISPVLEVFGWEPGASFTLTADRPVTLAGLDFDLGVPGMASNFTLECRVAGKWQKVSLLHYRDGESTVHTGNEIGGMSADAIRLTNTSGQTQQVKFNSFRFNKR